MLKSIAFYIYLQQLFPTPLKIPLSFYTAHTYPIYNYYYIIRCNQCGYFGSYTQEVLMIFVDNVSIIPLTLDPERFLELLYPESRQSDQFAGSARSRDFTVDGVRKTVQFSYSDLDGFVMLTSAPDTNIEYVFKLEGSGNGLFIKPVEPVPAPADAEQLYEEIAKAIRTMNEE